MKNKRKKLSITITTILVSVLVVLNFVSTVILVITTNNGMDKNKMHSW